MSINHFLLVPIQFVIDFLLVFDDMNRIMHIDSFNNIIFTFNFR
jgi:hypothetical protein